MRNHYRVGMNDESPFFNYFLATRMQRGDAVQDLIHSLSTFREWLQVDARGALDDLLERAELHSGKVYLAPGCEPIEFLLLTMLIEQRKELSRIRSEMDELGGLSFLTETQRVGSEE